MVHPIGLRVAVAGRLGDLLGQADGECRVGQHTVRVGQG